jgi:hypothetical protein
VQPKTVIRELTDEEMDAYREPFKSREARGGVAAGYLAFLPRRAERGNRA